MPRARFDPHDPSHQRPLTSLRHRRVADPSRYGPPSPPSTNPCGPPRGQGVGNARQQVHEGGDNVGTAAAVRPKSPLLPSARPSTAVDNRKFAACPAPAFLRASRVASPLSWRVCRVPVPAPLRPRRRLYAVARQLLHLTRRPPLTHQAYASLHVPQHPSFAQLRTASVA